MSEELQTPTEQMQTPGLPPQIPTGEKPAPGENKPMEPHAARRARNPFVPMLVAAGVIVGILLGSFFSSHYSRRSLSIINSSSNKINDLFHLIDDRYVDTVDIPDLVEKSMPQILKQLDPHSTYFSPKLAGESMQELEGKFSGVGVQFTIYQDTVRIVRIIKGGPSESVGLRAGDAIVNVDGKPFTGPKITNDTVLARLKGPQGTSVCLDVRRAGTPEPLSFRIVRDDVPVPSVSAAYKMDDGTGYIRITTFANTTHSEFLAALASLQAGGLKGLIVDLRGNLGGLMEPAVQIANEFLPADRLIVYTQGRRSPRQEYVSDGRGVYQQLPLVVLIDEVSASASEIFAGAMQDNDRGTIVGRRSFGKGLVQVPIEFDDGSLLRLTIARYYTPSGRCVQKPYQPGQEEEYEADLLIRATSGEYQSADSIKTQGEAYKTRLGRDVYGGGGIIPDLFVAEDTTGRTSYFMEAYMRGLLYQYAYVFTDEHRASLARSSGADNVVATLQRYDLVEDFATFAANNGLKRRNLLIRQSAEQIRSYVTSQILLILYGTQEAARYENQNDECVARALELVSEGRTQPELPTAEKAAARLSLPRGTMRDFRTWSHYAEARTRMLWSPSLNLIAVCPQKKTRSGHA